MAGDDAVELGQRLDLIDDDAAHLRGAVGGLLRQFEDAAAQFGAGRLQLALHLGGHLPHALQRLGEALRGLREHLVGLAAVLGVDAVQQLAGALALLLRARGAPSALKSATMRAISRARPVAPSSDSSSRLEKRLSRCSMSSVRVSSVATSVSIAARRSAKAASAWRLLLSISATASASERPWASNWVASWPRSVSALLVMAWNELMCWSTWPWPRRCVSDTSFIVDDELGDAGHERVLDRAHVLVRAAQAPPAAGCWPRAAARTASWCRSAACCASPASRRRWPTWSASTARSRSWCCPAAP